MQRLFTRIWILSVLSASLSIAGELNENTQKSDSPFEAISELVKSVKNAETFIIANGTTIPQGMALASLKAQALTMGTDSEAEILAPTIQRSPAIISADGIVGEKGGYSTFGAIQIDEGAAIEDGDSIESVSFGKLPSIGNAATVFKQVKEIGSRLPIPLAEVRNSPPRLDRDTQGSPISPSNSMTTFGTSSSQDATLAGLTNSKKKERDEEELKAKDAEALATLRDKKKEEEQKAAKRAELMQQIAKLKEIEPEYQLEDYRSMREFFKNGDGAYGKITEKDSAFEEKAKEVFEAFGHRDRDDAKKPYQSFYEAKLSEESDKFPEAAKKESPKRTTHEER